MAASAADRRCPAAVPRRGDRRDQAPARPGAGRRPDPPPWSGGRSGPRPAPRASSPRSGRLCDRSWAISATSPAKIPPEAAGIGFGGPGRRREGPHPPLASGRGLGRLRAGPTGRGRRSESPGSPVQNDADTAGLGEALFGAGVGHSPVFYAHDRQRDRRRADHRRPDLSGLRASARPRSATSGSMTEGPRRPSATRRHRLRLGHRLEGRDLIIGREAQSPGLTPAVVDAQAVARAAADGDPLALSVLANGPRTPSGRRWPTSSTLLGPRRIILGGGVSLMGEPLWIAPIRDRLGNESSRPSGIPSTRCRPTRRIEVVVHGALALARQVS